MFVDIGHILVIHEAMEVVCGSCDDLAEQTAKRKRKKKVELVLNF